jgi:hypothetical protein
MNQEEKVHHNIDKLAVKEALQEWLDKKWDETCLKFGRWSIRALALLAFGAFVFFLLWANGWHKP